MIGQRRVTKYIESCFSPSKVDFKLNCIHEFKVLDMYETWHCLNIFYRGLKLNFRNRVPLYSKINFLYLVDYRVTLVTCDWCQFLT